jgi:two-component system sensor histidine kinase PilS (NtrC family)
MDDDRFAPALYLEQIVAKGCVVRLGLLGCLVLLTGMDWTGLPVFQDRFIIFQGPVFTWFLVLGFSLNIFYLLFWKRFSNLYRFFRLQLVSDLILAGFWILLSGGVSSGFIFLFLVIAFFYGRIFGFSGTLLTSLLMVLYLACLGVWQFTHPELWGQTGYASGYLLYNFSLQALALILVCMLALIGRRQERYMASALLKKERALVMAEELKGHVFDWMDSGLLLVEADGTIATMNRTALQWAGMERVEEGVGVPLGKVFPEIESFRRSHPNKEIRRQVLSCRAMGGVFGIKITSVPEVRKTLILFSDITPYVTLEERVRTMEKLASIGELAAGLAHEIKNPLAGIKASLQLLAGGNLGPEHTDRLHRVIVRDIDRLDVLLKDFLAYARPSPGAPERLDPLAVAEEAVAALEAGYPHVRVVVAGREAGPEWSWDRGQLYQVLYNLLLNGFQAARSELAVRWTSHAAGVEIVDDGSGLDGTIRARLFEPFVTSREQGTGLGLAIAQRLAAANGYYIELRDRADAHGTSAVILPLSEESDTGSSGN